MYEWQPIETAPKDGTVILSDEGSCVWVSGAYNGTDYSGAWHLAGAGGWIPTCADWGEETSVIPTFTRWMPFPK